MDRTKELGESTIRKLLFKFSLPATIGMLINAIYNIVDRIYIGNSPDLGTLGLAGITISFPITIIMMALAVLFGIGGATLFSIKLGEKKPDEAESILGCSFVLLVISSIVFTISSLLFLRPILSAFGASNDVLPYAVEYMRIVLFGAIFQGISMGGNNFIRADGSPKIAMISMFLGAGFNIIFDPLFIYVFRWGMTGAALATIGGQALTAIWVLIYFHGKKSSRKLRFSKMRLDLMLVQLITSTGTPAFLTHFANSALNIVLNMNLAIYGGDLAVSTMGIINSLQTFILMPVYGINQGAQPIIGYNYGAKSATRVKETLKWAILSATAIAVLGYIVILLFSRQLIAMFNRSSDLLDFGSKAIIIWFLLLPVVGFQSVGARYFQAVGKARPAIFLTLTRQVIVLIPTIIILPKFFGISGILYAAPLADLVSAFITGIWLLNEVRHLRIEIA
jgi:putative MATE family efflux protein